MPSSSISIRPELQPFISRIEVSAGAARGEPYHVFPGMGAVMGFQLTGALDVIRGGKGRRLSWSGITGLQNQGRLFQAHGVTTTLLFFCKPWGAAAFFRESMRHLTDGHWSLEELLGSSSVATLRERVAALPANQAIRAVQAFLIEKVRTARRVVPTSVIHAAQRIAVDPTIRINPLADAVGISPRQLERTFQEVIGLPPKSFASIARFQAVLKQLGHASSLADAAILCGYYDQAHLSNELKRFTGRTAKTLMSDFSKKPPSLSR